MVLCDVSDHGVALWCGFGGICVDQRGPRFLTHMHQRGEKMGEKERGVGGSYGGGLRGCKGCGRERDVTKKARKILTNNICLALFGEF